MIGLSLVLALQAASAPSSERYLKCAALEARRLEPSGESVELIDEAVKSACFVFLQESASASGLAVMEAEDVALYRHDPAFRKKADAMFSEAMVGFGREVVVRVVLEARAKAKQR